MHHHESGNNMHFDPSDPIGSARSMIEMSQYGSEFRGSPAIQCIAALVNIAGGDKGGKPLDERMLAVEVSSSKGKTTAELMAYLEGIAQQSVTARFANFGKILLSAIQSNPADAEFIIAQTLQQQFADGKREQRALDLMFYGSAVQRVVVPVRDEGGA